jgi:ribosomal protein S18 acetylase RimI-like enzyme
MKDSKQPMPSLRAATTAEDIDTVVTLAREIWSEHFIPIIGKPQVDYMLEKLQSAPAIGRQIREEGYEYFVLVDESKPFGYFALVAQEQSASMQLSKLYLKRAFRGHGLGQAMLAFIEQECATRGIGELWLTVNKDNADAIAFYRRVGFRIVEPMVTDIGSGFFMDDYRMKKTVDRGRP